MEDKPEDKLKRQRNEASGKSAFMHTAEALFGSDEIMAMLMKAGASK